VKVLVVEDEVRLAQALRRGLQAEGFTVDLAHDGEDGLHLALEGDYAAIVLDIMLPRLSGYRVCQQLRAAENWVPVLMLSAKDGEYDEADGLDIGADDYLAKPFSPNELVARVRALLRRSKRAETPAATLTFGPIVMDLARHTVADAGRDVKLTAKEFLLLQYLLEHRGRVLSRDVLLGDVWGYRYTGGTRTVDVHVRRLREKLPALVDALVTVKQFGYKLADNEVT